MKRLWLIIWVGCFIVFLSFTQGAFAVSAEDSVQTTTQNDDELILDDIDIQGNVEKPGVIVMPTRVDSEIGQMELERSFDDELKNGMETMPQPQDALGQVDDVKSIKKAVERKRN